MERYSSCAVSYFRPNWLKYPSFAQGNFAIWTWHNPNWVVNHFLYFCPWIPRLTEPHWSRIYHCCAHVIPMLSHVIPVDQDFGAGGGRGCYLGDESHQHQSGAAWKGRVTFGVNNIISWYFMGYWIPFKIYKLLLYSHEIWCKVINSIIATDNQLERILGKKIWLFHAFWTF